jgi:hypothetical protein
MTWTCLLLAGANGGAYDVAYKAKFLKIPIRISPEAQRDVRQLRLFLSRDQGRTWEEVGKATPDKTAFDFTADADGIHWFSVAVIDPYGRQNPADMAKAPVGQKILIDTVKPAVHILSAERQGDEVLVSWEAQDANPQWESFKLEYRLGDSPAAPWMPIKAEPSPRSNVRFRPGLPGEVTIRLVLKDVADNEGTDQKVVPAAPGGFDRLTAGAGAGAVATPAAGGATPPGSGSPPTPGEGGVRPASGVSTAAKPASDLPPPPSGVDDPPKERHDAPQERHDPPKERHDAPAAVASSAASDILGPSPGGPQPTPRRLGALPPLRIVPKKQVKLDFQVGKFGPSGLGSVDVYVTTDEGANWEKTAADPSVSLPAPAEPKGKGPVRGSVTVTLPKDGIIYGFYLVVKSRAGLGKRPPQPGDTPQVRIEVDTVFPHAELYRPVPAPENHEALLLTWKAEDRNLDVNPITLEWSPNHEGPWECIGAARMPNSGRFVWKVPESIPFKVYLKLTARDTAGNVSFAVTPEPVLIDLTEPDVMSVNIQAGGNP